MVEHYFSPNPSVGTDPHLIEDTVCGISLTFVTDGGVFSRNRIDFGSRLLAETMTIAEGSSVLDLGCGYGVLGIVAAKVTPDGLVTMVDVNERATGLAMLNCSRNGVANVNVLQSDGFSRLEGMRFDCILTNPPIRAGKKVVHSFFADSAKHLQPNGALWVVIQKKQGAPSAKKKLQEIYSAVDDLARDAGYHVFRCRIPFASVD